MLKDAADWVTAGCKRQDIENLAAVTPLWGLQVVRAQIIVSDRFLRDITHEAWEALLAANNPASIFQRGRQLVDIIIDEKKEPVIRILDKAGFKGIIDRTADFIKVNREGEELPARPPSDVLDDMMTAKDLQLPILNGISEVPIFDPSGLFCKTPGYQSLTGFYLYSPKNLTIGDVPDIPDEKAVAKARSLLLDELLVDFPFVDDADKANAIAVLILPFVRLLIDGPTPLHLIESPTPGSGKGLLADVLAIPANGTGPATMTEGRDEDEWRKRITSKLMSGPHFVLIDNIKSRLDSAALSSALTSEKWEDRLLGVSKMVTLLVMCTWMATANNPSLSLEVARRDVSIRLNANVEKPWERTGFKHPNLRRWAQKNRGELVWAALTLTQNWIAKGKPSGKISLGSYESWSEVIGGILLSGGIEGFLTNRDRVYVEANEEIIAWGEFCSAWWQEYQNMAVTVNHLFGLATRRHLLVEILAGRNELSARTMLGKELSRMRDRVIGKYRILHRGENKHSKTQTYKLEVIAISNNDNAGVAGVAGVITPDEKTSSFEKEIINEFCENTKTFVAQEIIEDSQVPRNPRNPRSEKRCDNLDATLIASGDKLKIGVPKELPEEILNDLVESEGRVLAELRLGEKNTSVSCLPEKWREMSIPNWRRILCESISTNDQKREQYARLMLKEILQDQDPEETQL